MGAAKRGQKERQADILVFNHFFIGLEDLRLGCGVSQVVFKRCSTWNAPITKKIIALIAKIAYSQ
jgi:hypothetical protein